MVGKILARLITRDLNGIELTLAIDNCNLDIM